MVRQKSNASRIGKVFAKFRHIFKSDRKETKHEDDVIEIGDEDEDSSQLTDTDFHYFYRDEMLFKIPKKMLAKLTSEELDTIVESIKKKQKFNEKSKTIYIASPSTRRVPWDSTRSKSRRTFSRQTPLAHISSSSKHSDSSDDVKACKLKLRRQDRKSLDILHDCVCYSQYQIPEPGTFKSRAEVINDFLNTITNDIVDVNKEPIPKDPLALPALGAAGMYPTKKWLTELKRKGIKPEAGKHYKALRPLSNIGYRRDSTRRRTEEIRRVTGPSTKSLRRDGELAKKKILDSKTRTNTAATVRNLTTRQFKSRRRSPLSSDSSSSSSE
ncbi:hypothetical protein M8J76_001215 [Diaphorina citri]|nr:hypothetical protein M8J76_001215 [Diaphorina citri]KAI5746940.1 hypothetical protein M8J77_009334 [Diaphorina citri]